MRLLGKAAAVGLVISALLPFTNAQASSKVLSETKSIQDCVSEKRNLDVLMLVDESSSLKGDKSKPGNDPDDLRVDALKSIAQVLASTVDASNGGEESSSEIGGFEVKLSIAGFGSEYISRKSLDELDGESLRGFIESIDAQRDFDNDSRTRYHIGLSGALQDFISHQQNGKEACRLLIWFSDGVHNDDGRTGFVSDELKQITDQLCGEGNIVDQLRAEDVFIVAAGLNSNEDELGLMRLIAEGGDPFGQIASKCGSRAPTGVFERANKAEEIINTIFSVLDGVPGIPTDSVLLPGCSDGTTNCNEIAFTADGTISSFTILATRPNTNVVTQLKMSNDQTVDLFPAPGKAPDQKNVASFFYVSETKVLVAVSRSTGASIDGNWALQFKGVGSAEAIGAVNFVGNAQISIDEVSDSRKTLKRNRFGAKQILVNVKSKSSGASIREVEVSLANFEGVKDLSTTRDDLDIFTVSSNSLESALKSPVLVDASSATLRITPVGDVPGLTTLDGRPVKVEFNSETYEVLISNGASYPTFKGIKESDIRFKGTPTKTVTLLFDGPDGADGSVEFGQFKDLDEAANFEIVDPKTCVIPVKSSDFECEVKIVLNKVAYGDFNLPLPVTYVSSDGPQEAEVVIPVKALKPTNAGKGILAAFELLAIFLVIQGLVRLLLSYLMSRFSQITAPTSRRVRLDAVVDSNGALTLNPLIVNPSQSDESFTFENVESTTSFNIFGYQFDCSVLRTFLKSTSRPVGLVSRDSFVVIGSRGCQSNKTNPQNALGLVELSLRGQWVVGVKAADVQSLTNGGMSVPAEVVAFLDPYEQIDGSSNRAEQLSGLSLTIASSNFASEFSDVVSRFRELNQVDEIDTPGSDGWDSATTSPSGTSVSGFDAFGDSIGATQVESTTEVKGKSKEKRKKKEKNVGIEQESSSGSSSQSANTDWDPFA